MYNRIEHMFFMAVLDLGQLPVFPVFMCVGKSDVAIDLAFLPSVSVDKLLSSALQMRVPVDALVVPMKSEVYLRSQLQDIIQGLATTANWLPAVASSNDAEIFHAGFLAALNAVAVSLSIRLDLHQGSGSRVVIAHDSSSKPHTLID